MKLVCQWDGWKTGDKVEVSELHLLATSSDLYICSAISPVACYVAGEIINAPRGFVGSYGDLGRGEMPDVYMWQSAG